MKGVGIGAGVGGVAVTSALIYGVWSTSRTGYETAPYTVVYKDNDYEIRDYPTINIVETSGSFGKLYKFITGSNDRKAEIPMTTPVFMI